MRDNKGSGRNSRRGQQEMVGFVLIVVIVVIALMVFLVISIRKPDEMKQNKEIENALSAILKKTTGCAVNFEPDYDSVEDLIKSCRDNEKCANLNKMACDYLNETMADIINAVLKTEAGVSAYEFVVFVEENDGGGEMFKMTGGNCTGTLNGAQRIIYSSGENIIIRTRFCY